MITSLHNQGIPSLLQERCSNLMIEQKSLRYLRLREKISLEIKIQRGCRIESGWCCVCTWEWEVEMSIINWSSLTLMCKSRLMHGKNYVQFSGTKTKMQVLNLFWGDGVFYTPCCFTIPRDPVWIPINLFIIVTSYSVDHLFKVIPAYGCRSITANEFNLAKDLNNLYM